MCDVKTIAATVMPKKCRSNLNAELSPLQKYRKTTLILDLKIIKATAMLDNLPCKIWEDNSCIRFESYKSNCNAGLSPLQKYGKVTLVCDVKTIAATVMPKKCRSNRDAELSPLQKYRKTTLILDLKIIKQMQCWIISPAKIWEDYSCV